VLTLATSHTPQVRLGDKLVASSADRTLTFFDLSFERLKLEGKCSVQAAPMTLLVYDLPAPSSDVVRAPAS
jgi:hypothetical protein